MIAESHHHHHVKRSHKIFNENLECQSVFIYCLKAFQAVTQIIIFVSSTSFLARQFFRNFCAISAIHISKCLASSGSFALTFYISVAYTF